MLAYKQIEKIGSRTVNITFGSHHVIRTTACFFNPGYFSEARNLDAIFPRGPNSDYKSQAQGREVSLSHEILSHLTLHVFNGCSTIQMEIPLRLGFGSRHGLKWESW